MGVLAHRPSDRHHPQPPARWVVVAEGIAALVLLVVLVGGGAAALTWAAVRAVHFVLVG